MARLTASGPRRASGNLRIGDHWNAITIIALSQSNPLKAVAELVENSIDARAKSIVITRGKDRGQHYLRVKDDGEGVRRNADGEPDFHHVATHVCDSIKRRLKAQGTRGLQGEFGIGLLSFWTLGEDLLLTSSRRWRRGSPRSSRISSGRKRSGRAATCCARCKERSRRCCLRFLPRSTTGSICIAARAGAGRGRRRRPRSTRLRCRRGNGRSRWIRPKTATIRSRSDSSSSLRGRCFRRSSRPLRVWSKSAARGRCVPSRGIGPGGPSTRTWHLPGRCWKAKGRWRRSSARSRPSTQAMSRASPAWRSSSLRPMWRAGPKRRSR
ncbi:MAG: ATP-binding protein [Burkholderiales bacterium]|nr:ATP-binding protein [Burkholderiales bacterium]